MDLTTCVSVKYKPHKVVKEFPSDKKPLIAFLPDRFFIKIFCAKGCADGVESIQRLFKNLRVLMCSQHKLLIKQAKEFPDYHLT